MNILSKTSFALAALASLSAAALLPAGAATNKPRVSPSTTSHSISIFATGVDSNGATLANGTLGDPHYSLLSVPTGTTSNHVLQVLTSAAGTYPFPEWMADSSTSAWIAPDNNPFVSSGIQGYYDYRTTFSLAGDDPATASLSGGWAMDNFGTDILINGKSTGNTAESSNYMQNVYTPFSITSGFQSGLNTLDFIVLDDGQGGTGLRVDGIHGTALGGTAFSNPVPEAATTVSFGLLLALGLGGLVIARRKSVQA